MVFDLGGVVVDWNPRYLMERVISDAGRRDHFLKNIITGAFLLELDIAPIAKTAIAPFLEKHPEYAAEISAYVDRFEETIGGEFPEMASLARRLHANQVALFGLTNWAGDTFDLVRPHLPTLGLLRDIVVSGHEGIVKPDPRIFDLVCRRGGFPAGQAVFIDDNLTNVEAAKAFGMAGVHHRSAAETIAELQTLGLPA